MCVRLLWDVATKLLFLSPLLFLHQNGDNFIRAQKHNLIMLDIMMRN